MVIDIADDDAQEVFVCDCITNSATLAIRYVLSLSCVGGCLNMFLCSRGISGTTRPILTMITDTTDYFVAHSKPNVPA